MTPNNGSYKKFPKFQQIKAKPRSNIAKLKIQLSDTKVELISVKRKSGMAEQNLSLQVTRMNLTKKNNELKWANFITTLEIKNPIYADVKIVAFENDTVYHNLKAVYALKVSRQRKFSVRRPSRDVHRPRPVAPG